jgi:acyl transferase domain-containing protein/acyl carrier protein
MTELLEPIAIIGMAGRFPGAGDVSEFWRVLANGAECVEFPSAERLLAAGVPESALRDPDYVPAVALPDALTDFDAPFFGFTPREATLCDPQIRLFLETAHAALENAGYAPERLGSVGVFGSAGVNRYHDLYGKAASAELRSASGMSIGTLNNPDYVATLVSYKFGFNGPSMTVQTACSSALVAAHLAAQSLRSGECEVALAGGADVELPLGHGHWWAPGSPLSRDGHCRPFDAGATGTIFGSGAGVVVLKLLSDALRDGDDIRAVIRSSAINNDGSDKIGFSAPSVRGQAAAVIEAMEMGGFRPADISYVEAHATGTELGDPIELEALNQAYRQLSGGDLAPGGCPIASVKGNVGHLGHAAGVTSLIKVVLSLQHELIPANINFETPNPKLPLDGSPFVVNQHATPWPAQPGRTRLAGVNSLGIGGTNVHMIVGEAPSAAPVSPDDRPRLVVWSARTAAARDAAQGVLAEHFGSLPENRFAGAVATLQRGRTEHAVRGAVVASSAAQAAESVLAFTGTSASKVDSVGFLLPGQGSQHAAMAAGLHESDETFCATFDECLAHLRTHGCDVLRPWRESTDVTDTRLAQPLLFAVEYALAAMWASWGVRPDWLLGHSIGELTAAAVAEVVDLPAAAALVAARARAMAAVAPGTMLAVRASADDLLADLPEGVEVAVVNGPGQVVLAGPHDAIDAYAALLAGSGVAARRVRTSHAFHSSAMRAAEPEFRAAFDGVTLRAPRIPVISAATGAALTAEQATDPAFWVGQLSQPVRFDQALDTALADRPCLTLEVGPGRVLTDLVGDRAIAVASLSRRAGGDLRSALTAAGTVWTHGIRIDWAAADGGGEFRRVAVPGYRYERARHWLDPAPAHHTEAPENVETTAVIAPEAVVPQPEPDLAVPDFTVPTWTVADDVTARDFADGDVAVALLPAADDRALDIVVALQRAGLRVVPLYPAARFRELYEGFELGADLDADVRRAFTELSARGVTPRLLVHALAIGGWEAAGTRVVDRQLDESFHSLLCLVREGHRHATGALPGVVAIARNSVDVSGDERVDPVKATMHGVVLTLAAEESRATYKLIDIGARVDEDLLVAELAAGARDELVALRGPRRWLRGLRSFDAEPSGERALRRGGVYLITGGLGGLGMAVARSLAGGGLRPTLVLLGRTADGGERRPEIAALEQMGARVAVVAADVTEPRALRRALDVAAGRFGTVNGVFHLAGVAGNGMLHVRSTQEMNQVLAPKVRGTLALAEAFSTRPALDFFVAFSSRAAIAGHRGSGDYAAANAFLDAFATTEVLPGCRVVSLNWPAWHSIGMAVPTLTASARAAITWRTTLRPDGCPVLDEHRINGRALLPGTGHLDLIVRAFRERLGVGEDRSVRLDEVVFERPFVVHAELDWQIDFEPEPGGGHRFTVHSGHAAQRTVHVRGSVTECARELASRDLDELRERLPDVQPPPQRVPGRRMFLLGPRWSNVTAIRTGAAGAAEKLVSLALPEVFAVEAEEHQLHPTLLDSATSHARDAATDGFHLPFGYSSLTVHGRLGPELLAHIRRAPGGGEVISADVEVMDPQGRVLVSVTGFAMRRVTDTAFVDVVPVEQRAEPDEIAGIAPEAGARMLLRLLDARLPRQVVISRHRNGLPVHDDELALVPRSAAERVVTAESPAPRPPEPARPVVATPVAVEPVHVPSDGTVLERVRAVFALSLGIPEIGPADDFFDLGGNSLTAVEVMTSVRKEFKVDLSIAALFDHPTVEQLADELRRRGVS